MSHKILIQSVFFLYLITGASQSFALELDAKFYGEVNVAYDSVSDGDSDFQSWVSRVGVKGKAPLSETISIIYQIEQEVDPIHGGLNAANFSVCETPSWAWKLISENSFSATTIHR